MRERLTPISRNELIDLEDLFQQFHEHHRHLFHSSLLHSSGRSAGSPSSSSYPGSPGFASPTSWDKSSGGDKSAPSRFSPGGGLPQAQLYLHDNPAVHPLVNGRFCDVFEDIFTSHRWRVHERMLYVVWWSFRPAFCQDCGMQDAWLPSKDGEFKCAQCGTFAGSTKGNKVVQDSAPAVVTQASGARAGPPPMASHAQRSDDDDDDDGDEGDEKIGADPDGDEADATANILSVYTFLYEWLTWIPSPGPLHRSRPLFQLPSGEALPTVLRAAYDLSLVLTMPTAVSGNELVSSAVKVTENVSAPFSSAPLIARGCSLYLSLLLHQFPIPFPLFVQGMRGGRYAARGGGSGEQLNAGGGGSATLEWVDVECAAMLTGVPLNDFFEGLPPDPSDDVSVGGNSAAALRHHPAVLYLENVAAVCEAARRPVPSVMWDVSRVPHHITFLRDEVARRRLPRHPTLPRLHRSCAMVTTQSSEAEEAVEDLGDGIASACFSGTRGHTHTALSLCPEHTTMAVIMALAREVDRRSLWSLGVQIVAAADRKRARRKRSRTEERMSGAIEHEGCSDAKHGSDHQASEQADEAYVLANPKLVQKAWEVAEYHAERLAKWGEDENLYGGWSSKAPSPLPVLYPSLASFDGDRAAWHEALKEPAAHRFQPYVSAAERALTTAGSATQTPAPKEEEGEDALVRDVYFTDSPSANALIFLFARAFLHTQHPFDLADLVRRSGLYAGEHRCSEVLQVAATSGDFSLLPLVRRLSPLISMWITPYLALHSSDRLPFIAAIRLLHYMQNASGKSYMMTIQQLQRILAKYGGVRYYQMNYVVRVTDPRERNFNGFYFLSAVYGKKGIAVFTCIRSGRKTIAFNAHNRLISLFYWNERERTVRDLQMHFISGETPVIAGIETSSTALVMDVARPYDGSRSQFKNHAWTIVVRLMERCGCLRRRMRMPMLASRLDALSSIRELGNWGVDGESGGNADNAGSMEGAGGPDGQILMSATHASGSVPPRGGGGQWSSAEVTGTEYDLTCTDPFDLRQCRDAIQREVLALESNPSFLFGLSDDRVVALYAMTVAFLEFIATKQIEWKRLHQNGPGEGGAAAKLPPGGDLVTSTSASLTPPHSNRRPSSSAAAAEREARGIPQGRMQRGGGGGVGGSSRAGPPGRRAQLSPPVVPKRSPILSPYSLPSGGHHRAHPAHEDTETSEGPSAGIVTLLNWVEELCHSEFRDGAASSDDDVDLDDNEEEAGEERNSGNDDDDGDKNNNANNGASSSPPPSREEGPRRGRPMAGNGVDDDDDEAGLGYASALARHALLPPSTAAASGNNNNNNSNSSAGGGGLGSRRAAQLTPPHPPAFTVSSTATGSLFMPPSRRQARLTMTPVQTAKKSPIIERLPPPLALPPSTRTSGSGAGGEAPEEEHHGRLGRTKSTRGGGAAPVSPSLVEQRQRRREAMLALRRSIKQRYLGAIPTFKEVLVDGGLDALFELQKSMQREAGLDEEDDDGDDDDSSDSDAASSTSSTTSSTSSSASASASSASSSSSCASRASGSLARVQNEEQEAGGGSGALSDVDDETTTSKGVKPNHRTSPPLHSSTPSASSPSAHPTAARTSPCSPDGGLTPTPATHEGSRGDVVAPSPPRGEGDSSSDAATGILLDSFTLFDADKCRRKLTHIIVFIRAYHRFKSELRTHLSAMVKRSTIISSTAAADQVSPATASSRLPPHPTVVSPNPPPSPFELPSTTMAASQRDGVTGSNTTRGSSPAEHPATPPMSNEKSRKRNRDRSATSSVSPPSRDADAPPIVSSLVEALVLPQTTSSSSSPSTTQRQRQRNPHHPSTLQGGGVPRRRRSTSSSSSSSARSASGSDSDGEKPSARRSPENITTSPPEADKQPPPPYGHRRARNKDTGRRRRRRVEQENQQ